MADSGIFATTAEVGYKAGSGASAVSNTELYINSFMSQAESFINSYCRYNFSDNYTTLNVDKKGILKEVASNLAAIYVIQYDMSGFASRTAAEDMINVLRDAAIRGLAVLKEQAAKDFVNAA